MFNFFKKQKTVETQQQEEKRTMWDNLPTNGMSAEEMYLIGHQHAIRKKATLSESVGQDSCVAPVQWGIDINNGVNPLLFNWYASQSFIGFQTMAIIAQNGMMSKAMNIPAKDATRKGWDIELDEEVENAKDIIKYIRILDDKFSIENKLINQSVFTKIFGIRVAVFDIDSSDKEFYEKPFNIDGVTKGSFRGIKQIDPYWCTPYTTSGNVMNPANIDFYEPTYWMIQGRKYHKSHLIITRGDEVADILKPTYQYAGLSLVQKVYQRLYQAERTADEAPTLVQTKRTNVYKMEGVAEALVNFGAFQQKMAQWQQLTSNYQVRFIDAQDELQILDTSLADLDTTIMTQFQLFCSLVNIPSYKLLNAPMKGFSSGETEESSYHEYLEDIQKHEMNPLLNRYYLILAKSEIEPKFKIKASITVNWKELDSVTEKERAEINKIKAETDAIHTNAGHIAQEDVSNRLSKDKTSDYFGVEFAEIDEDLFNDEPLDLTGADSKGLDYIEKESGKFIVKSESGKRLGEYKTEVEAKKRLGEIEYFKNKEKG